MKITKRNSILLSLLTLMSVFFLNVPGAKAHNDSAGNSNEPGVGEVENMIGKTVSAESEMMDENAQHNMMMEGLGIDNTQLAEWHFMAGGLTWLLLLAFLSSGTYFFTKQANKK